MRDDAGGLVVSEPYIPPCLRVGASPFLMAGLRRLLGTMVTRHTALSEARREAGKSMVEFGAKDVTRFLLLSTINTYIPVLTHVVDSGHVSPHACYLLLSQLARPAHHVLDRDRARPTFPRFVYTDLRSTFEELFARLDRAVAVDDRRALRHRSRSRAAPDGMYVAALQEERLWALRSLPARDQDRHARAAHRDPGAALCEDRVLAEINGILSAATPGAPVEVTYRPPPEIPVKAGLVYFAWPPRTHTGATSSRRRTSPSICRRCSTRPRPRSR